MSRRMSVRQRAAYTSRPPVVVPRPESLAAQAAYTEALLPGSGLGPNCFLALGVVKSGPF